MASLIVEILDHLTAVEQWLPQPQDEQEIAAFAESMSAAEDDIMTDEQPATAVAAAITSTLIDSWRAIAAATIRAPPAQPPAVDTAARDAAIAAILARKSVEQRTAAWYAQAATVLTASEFYTIFRKTRARALLAHAKAKPPTPEELANKHSLPLTSASEYMSAFDWGIRFEPVVKQIYEHIQHRSICQHLTGESVSNPSSNKSMNTFAASKLPTWGDSCTRPIRAWPPPPMVSLQPAQNPPIP